MPEEFLFVSHVSEDRDAATQVVEELERRGLRCWIAPRNVRPGRPFDDEIASAIETCQAMLLIFSERCNDSEYIRREVTVAGESHKVVIPFRIENVEPKRGLRVRLSDLHWLDGFASREKAIDELISIFPAPSEPNEKAILESAGRATEGAKLRQPQRSEARPPWRPSLLAVAATMATCLILAAIGIWAYRFISTPVPVQNNAQAERIAGNYLATGINGNGTAYRGTVVITSDGGVRYSFHWQIGNSTYDGIGVVNGNTITVDWGQSSAVIYQVGADGVLRGTWDNGHATEILTPR
jgi:TIR domain